ncbi:MAG TPA: pyrroloquinoline quinone biosynthesis protein PqqB [Terriglobales bacterium]|nr:pyrroloquinoline quinone biosynthesis protein PqqB [Terriglobales bacterium]
MRIEILGSAAGGGFPQWNCNCRNCHALRAGIFHGKARTQTQVAVSSGQDSWFLLNASPDLRMQIESSSFLHPRAGQRDSPISGVLLTSGDVDQIAGLLSLRELQPFRIYCTPSIQRVLREDNSIFGMLNRVADQVSWSEIRIGQGLPLLNAQGHDCGICASAFSMEGRYPPYVSARRRASLRSEEASISVALQSPSRRSLVYLPAVPRIDDSLLQRLESADLLFFDGSFWTDDELIRVQGSGVTAREMGHVPVSGPDGSLQLLANLRRPRKIFIHINNTNPMLDEAGPEYREVRDAGWEIAEDGIHFDL